MNFQISNRGSIKTYQYPANCPQSNLFRVKAGDLPVFVYATNVADFACISFSGSLEVAVEITDPVSSAIIRPLSRRIEPVIQGNTVRFTLASPKNLQIEINGGKPLHFYGNPLESNLPSTDDPTVIFLKGGDVHELGRLELKDNQTLYLEGGAVLKGSVFATHAKNIRICGRGVVDGSLFRDKSPVRLILLDHCQDVTLQDIILIEPSTWMVVLGACRRVQITNLKEIGEVISSDGIDIVGCKQVTIEGCFLKNNDDCVVVKSCLAEEPTGEKFDWIEDVEDILIKRCVFMNDRAGNAMEIGHELRCDSVRNIKFQDIDVLHVHGLGAVFSIHNGDRARVEDVSWENIRVEHCYDLFIDFRVIKSMWSKDDQRGSIKNIRLKNIYWQRSIYNPGYTKSVMGGLSPADPLQDVIIENLYFDDRKIVNQDAMDLFTKSVTGLVII
jgi:Glycosyl hydrolases family 28